jgi:hypothetical protein
MLVDPAYWQTVPMIKISNDQLAERLNLDSKYASFRDILNEKGYILQEEVEEAYRKKPAYRSKYDNELLKVDERINICYLTYTFDFLRILPKENDASGKWYNPSEAHEVFSGEVSDFTHNIFPEVKNHACCYRNSGIPDSSCCTSEPDGSGNYQPCACAQILLAGDPRGNYYCKLRIPGTRCRYGSN